VITKTENDERTARNILLSMRLLEQRRERLEKSKNDASKRFADNLTDVSRDLHDLIESTAPIEDAECRERLLEIKDLFAARKDLENRKKIELDKIKATIAENDAAFHECLRAEPSAQQTLGFGDGKPTLGVSPQSELAISSAIDEVIELGTPETDSLTELRSMLTTLGESVEKHSAGQVAMGLS